jgi:hypothetical protein
MIAVWNAGIYMTDFVTYAFQASGTDAVINQEGSCGLDI